MCGSATLAMLLSSTSMNAASETVTAMIHGLTLGFQTMGSDMFPSPISLVTLLRKDSGIYVHTRAKDKSLGRIVQQNFYGNALDYLDVIASGVFGRQQAQ